MSRRVPHTRSVRRIPHFFAVFVAVLVVVVSAVAPVEVATASTSVASSTALAKTAADPAQAGIAKTSLAGFNAGNIISDAVFTNKNTLTEAQIQSFFNSKVSKCVVGNDENGKPFVCLKDFRISSVNMPADAYCSGYQGAANETAARIIYKVSQACNINPQVLIVMLQKEQGLVTHVWPSAWRYDKALGQGCPDTAPCDPKFVGFFHQIYGAARQMQMYMEGRWFTWYAPGKTWGILYHPNANCGRGNVYVANKATSALYYYTPYQPNAAALRAGYGEGDGCSSYGNRNFYNYFTDWFGSTQASVAPRAWLDEMRAIPGGVKVAGWAFVPGGSDATVKIHVTAGGAWKQTILADRSRPDVAAAFGISNKTTGYDAEVSLKSGDNRVCLRAENPRDGTTVEVGCRWLNIPNADVEGSLDTLRLAPGGAFIMGWAADGDSANAVKVQVLVDNRWSRTVLADKRRDDLGGNRGFEASIPLNPGTRKVCLVGENVNRGSSLAFPCVWLNVPTGAVLGEVKSWSAVPQGIKLSGWLLDPDTTAPVRVQVLIDNKWARTIVADAADDAVAAQYPHYGSAHGLQSTVSLAAGWHKVCLIADNVGGGATRDLGCRTTTVYAGKALGVFDSLTAVDGGASVRGWAIDPDTIDPVKVQVIVDNKWARTILAADTRPDVGKHYPAYGDGHGINSVISMSPGTHKVCLVADPIGGGAALDLGCKWLSVKGSNPVGSFEAARADVGTIRVSGWAYDPDQALPVKMQVLVDNRWHSTIIADLSRTDLASTYPSATSGGFDRTLSLSAGSHKVCIVAENVGSGTHTDLGCVWRDVS